jgi:hypothetical protein
MKFLIELKLLLDPFPEIAKFLNIEILYKASLEIDYIGKIVI